jgi:hypothetical protein
MTVLATPDSFLKQVQFQSRSSAGLQGLIESCSEHLRAP